MEEKMEEMKVVVLAAALLVLVLLFPMSVSASIVWDLDNDNVMYKYPHNETGNVTIEAGSSVVWRAEETAQCNVGFPSKVWGGQLNSTIQNYAVDIGYSESDGSDFVSNGVTGGQIGYYQGISYFAIDANAFTVPEGKYLALNVTAEESGTITTDGGSSFIVWPHDDPAYPVPELSTIFLTSVGLLALAGYVGWRRRG
jgi:hypothetical protein